MTLNSHSQPESMKECSRMLDIVDILYRTYVTYGRKANYCLGVVYQLPLLSLKFA